MVDRREGWNDFFKLNFDKLLLTGLVILFGLMAYRAYHVGVAEMAQFAVDNSKLFSGALLTLITGRLIANAQQQTPPPPSQPAPLTGGTNAANPQP